MEKKEKGIACADHSVSNMAERPRLDLDHERMRFKAATSAMQGLIASRLWNATDVAKEAVKYADALIEVLRKTQSKE